MELYDVKLSSLNSDRASKVGKTRFISTLTRAKYEGNVSTNGISVSEHKVSFEKNGQRADLVLKLYDFGGQTIFYPTHRLFLTKDSIYLVLFKASEPNTARLDYWLKVVGSLGGSGVGQTRFVELIHSRHSWQAKGANWTLVSALISKLL